MQMILFYIFKEGLQQRLDFQPFITDTSSDCQLNDTDSFSEKQLG